MASIRKALAQAALVVLLPVMAFSESSVREAMSGWLNDCLIVVSKHVATESPTRVAVRLRGSGELPKQLVVNFRANQGLIHEVRYFSIIDPSGLSTTTNLFLHYLNGQTCPGALCEGVPNGGEGERRRTVELPEVFAEADHRFNVELDRQATVTDLSVFVMQRKGQAGSCRVQNENFFNWYYRQEKPIRFVVALLMLAILLFAFTQLKSSKGAQ